MNTAEFLSISSSICPDRTALVFEGSRLSFRQLKERVDRLANAFRGLGVKKGDIVAFLDVNCHQAVEAYFAASELGAVYLPLNYRARESELEYMLSFVEVSHLLVGDRYLPIVDSLKSRLPALRHYISIQSPHEGMLDYEKLIDDSSHEPLTIESEDGETTILLYTAGTTGNPKCVMLPHRSFSTYVLENVTPPDPDVEEKNILTVPLYHVAGIQAMMSAIYGGRTLVMMRQFDAGSWMDLVEEEKVGRAMMVPTMLIQLMDHPDFRRHDLSSLRVITYGAAPMGISAIRRALDAFPGVKFVNAFGQTETASTITMLGPEDHVITGNPEERERKLRRLTSIGKPLPDVEMKVVDAKGAELPAGAIGEIVARGPQVMSGYYKDTEKTSQTIDRSGWVHTGDMAYRDEDGYFFLAGRATDSIKRGGEFISPEELENVICTHPKIQSVAVIGIHDEEWGELPKAICVLREGETSSSDEIIEYCRTRLASFKRPRSVIFISELPCNALGKVLKKELRERYGN
jgi:acyl-CoA synthetase (AMP-forming)/AMP-acid ligase II